jgi:hypothetical protein
MEKIINWDEFPKDQDSNLSEILSMEEKVVYN